jgi:hypothetical protein
MKLRILPEADAEAFAAAEWYDKQRIGLGEEFLQELGDRYEVIRSRSEACARVEEYSGDRDLRYVALARFSYFVVFQRRNQDILIAAVSHVRRQPLYWLDRLK